MDRGNTFIFGMFTNITQDRAVCRSCLHDTSSRMNTRVLQASWYDWREGHLEAQDSGRTFRPGTPGAHPGEIATECLVLNFPGYFQRMGDSLGPTPGPILHPTSWSAQSSSFGPRVWQHELTVLAEARLLKQQFLLSIDLFRDRNEKSTWFDQCFSILRNVSSLSLVTVCVQYLYLNKSVICISI